MIIFGAVYPAYANVGEWMILKGQGYDQISNNIQPTTQTFFYFDSWVNATSPADFSSVILNGAPGGPETLLPGFNTWIFEYETSTKLDLDTAFPNQAYIISTSGGNLGTFNENISFGSDSYPTQAPYLTGNTFNNLQGMDSSQDFTLMWNTPSSA